MSKDRRSDRKRCLRCTQWAEYGSELCADCEQDAVEEMNRLRLVDSAPESATEGWGFHGGISPEALRATHGFGPYVKAVSGTWEPTFTVKKGEEGYAPDYPDALDQERADSMEGGE